MSEDKEKEKKEDIIPLPAQSSYPTALLSTNPMLPKSQIGSRLTGGQIGFYDPITQELVAIYDPSSKRTIGIKPYGKNRCIAWRRQCDCGHRFPAKDLHPDGNRRRWVDNPPPCPDCGRARERCGNRPMIGALTCRYHGGACIGKQKKKPYNPITRAYDSEKRATLNSMLEEDDTSLKEEFHALRITFGEALAQYENDVEAYKHAMQAAQDAAEKALKENQPLPPVIIPPVDVLKGTDILIRLIDRLSSIAERRSKAEEKASEVSETIHRVEFSDPKIQYYLKELMRENELKTIRKVLAIVLDSVDPMGELGLVSKLPQSFLPYVPASKKAIAEEVQDADGTKTGS